MSKKTAKVITPAYANVNAAMLATEAADKNLKEAGIQFKAAVTIYRNDGATTIGEVLKAFAVDGVKAQEWPVKADGKTPVPLKDAKGVSEGGRKGNCFSTFLYRNYLSDLTEKSDEVKAAQRAKNAKRMQDAKAKKAKETADHEKQLKAAAVANISPLKAVDILKAFAAKNPANLELASAVDLVESLVIDASKRPAKPAKRRVNTPVATA